MSQRAGRHNTPEPPTSNNMTCVRPVEYQKVVEAEYQSPPTLPPQPPEVTEKPRASTATISRSGITWSFFKKEVLKGASEEKLRAKYILTGLPEDFFARVEALKDAYDSKEWQNFEAQLFEEWLS